jgi:hypothetical protein
VSLDVERVPVLHRAPDDDEVTVHVHRGHVVAESGPLIAYGRTIDDALARLGQARQLYRLLLVRPDSPAARRLASQINALYTAYGAGY